MTSDASTGEQSANAAVVVECERELCVVVVGLPRRGEPRTNVFGSAGSTVISVSYTAVLKIWQVSQ